MILKLHIDGIKRFLTNSKVRRTRPICLGIRSSKAFVISSCTLAIFTDCLLYGIVVPVIPFTLTQRAGIPSQDVGIWTSALLACYAGAWLIASPVAGYSSDYFTARRTSFVVALIALTIATILLYAGSSIEVLMLGRILQGIASAFTWTAGITLAVETVREEDVGKTLGVCSLGMHLALLLGPVVGGLLLDRSGYHSVFAVAFGLLSLDVAWRLALIEKNEAAAWVEFPRSKYWMMVFGNSGTPRIMPSPIEVDSADLEPFWLLGDIDVQMSDSHSEVDNALQASNRWTRTLRAISPTVRLLQNRRLQVALGATIAATTLLASLDAVLPLFVRDTFSWGPQGAGLIFIPIIVPTFLSPYVGDFVDRHGCKWVVSTAFVLGCPEWILLRFVTHVDAGQVVLLCCLLVLLGVTTTLASSPLMAEISFAVESQTPSLPRTSRSRGSVAQAYAWYSFSLAGGLLAGPLWGGVVLRLAGWKTLTWTFGLLSAIVSVPTICFTGGPLKPVSLFGRSGQRMTAVRNSPIPGA